MAGIFEMLNSPVAQGLLAGGLGAMASRGSRMQALGRGGLLGMQVYGQAAGQQQNRLIEDAKKLQQQQALAQLQPDANGLINATPATLVAAGFADPSKWDAIRNAGRDKIKEFQDVRNPDGTVQRVGFTDYGSTVDTGRAPAKELSNINGVATDMWNAQNGQVLAQDPNKPFYLDASGKPAANQAYQDYDTRKAAAGAARTNVMVDAAPKAFWNDFGKQASDQVFKERDGAQAAATTLQGIGEIRKAVEGGVYQGAGADYKLAAAKALGALGAQIAPEQVANSEQFSAISNQFVLNYIKGLGANPSNADREFIEKTVPRLSTDPGALPQLLNFMETKAKATIDSYNSKIKGIQQQPGAGFMPFSLEVPVPEAKPTQQPSKARRFNPATGRIE